MFIPQVTTMKNGRHDEQFKKQLIKNFKRQRQSE